MTIIHLGVCGFPKSRPVYFDTFMLDEIQQTFYRLPQLKTAERWRQEAPEGFIYTIKAWQLITHEPYLPTYRRLGKEIPRKEWAQYGSFRPTLEVMDAWEKTCEIAVALDARVVVFQCPPQFTPTQEHINHMSSFFERVERRGLLFAWEPRGNWSVEMIKDLCSTLNLIHCVDPFLTQPVPGSPAYFRLHGGPDYQHQYNDDELKKVAQWCLRETETYCLFNNATMWEDALRFKQLLNTETERGAG